MLENLKKRMNNRFRRNAVKKHAGVYGYTEDGWAIMIDPETGAVDFVDPETGKVLI